MNKILFFFYLRGYFRTCIFILNIASIFDKKYKDKISFYRYFKKKKKYKKELLKIVHQPKIFIFNFPYDSKKLIQKIYNYDLLYLDNQKINDGHKKVYQSKDNLNKKKEFREISKFMESLINKYISKYIQSKNLKLIKMWIVITKNLGVMRKHSHFNSDFSGVLYVKVDKYKSYQEDLKYIMLCKTLKFTLILKKKNHFKKV